jgi:hypothetical protein
VRRLSWALALALLASACGGNALQKGGGAGAGGTPAEIEDAGTSGAAGAEVEASAPADAPSVAVDTFIASLPGLVLWVDAARGVTLDSSGEVSSWKDQSPASNDLGPSIFPASRYAADGPGGHPVVRLFTGSRLGTPGDGTSSLGFRSGDFLVEVVWAWSGAMNQTPGLFGMWRLEEASQDPAGLMGLGVQGDGSTSLSLLAIEGHKTIEVTSTTKVTDVAFHVTGVRRVVAAGAATVELRVDGRADPMVSGVEVGDFGTSAWAALGGGANVAEVVVIKGSITDDEVALLENHLSSKYGLR